MEDIFKYFYDYYTIKKRFELHKRRYKNREDLLKKVFSRLSYEILSKTENRVAYLLETKYCILVVKYEKGVWILSKTFSNKEGKTFIWDDEWKPYLTKLAIEIHNNFGKIKSLKGLKILEKIGFNVIKAKIDNAIKIEITDIETKGSKYRIILEVKEKRNISDFKLAIIVAQSIETGIFMEEDDIDLAIRSYSNNLECINNYSVYTV